MFRCDWVPKPGTVHLVPRMGVTCRERGAEGPSAQYSEQLCSVDVCSTGDCAMMKNGKMFAKK